MKKRLIGSLLMGALLVSSVSVFVSCKDYDDDIASLQEQITANKNLVSQLQAAINDGKVISDVATVSEGIQITLNDGSKFTVKNGTNGLNGADGKDGAAGKDGVDGKDGKDGVDGQNGKDGADGKDAATWTIGEDGYWYLDGVLQPYKAVGQDGKDGKDGENGKDGKDGEDGKDGKDGAAAAVPTIGANGNWFVDGVDTGVKAKGEDGKDGAAGAAGKDGKDGKDGVDGNDGKNGQDGKNGTVITVGANGNWLIDGVDSGVKAQAQDGAKGEDGAKGADGKPGEYYTPNTETGNWDKHEYVDGAWKVTDTKISWKAASLTAVFDTNTGYLTISGVEGAENKTVKINCWTKLTSLVFQPDFYYEGIEAFDVATFEYPVWATYNRSANGNYYYDAPYAVLVNNVQRVQTIAPDMVATYHLNPANARVSTSNLDMWSFLPLDRKYVTRAASSNDFNVTEVEALDNGIVKVHARVNNGSDIIKNLSATSNDLTVVALQYTEGDSIITSDYAAIKKNNYDNFILNFAKLTQGNHNVGDTHLYPTAGDAIWTDYVASPVTPGTTLRDAQVKVAWNNPGIDLREYVNTHISINGAAEGQWDADADKTDHTAANKGFKYEFSIIGWTSSTQGVNTMQSVHAAIAEDGYTLRAQMPDANGNQVDFGQSEQNRATVGRQPLVRVVLKDTNNNNQIVAVGYFKVEITDTDYDVEDPEAATYEAGAVKDNYTLCCPTASSNIVKYVYWYELENQIISKILDDGISRNDFEANYELDVVTGATGTLQEAKQYADNKLSTNPIADTHTTDYLGTIVTTTEADDNGTLTQRLRWTATYQELYNWFYVQKKTSVVTYICYKKVANPTIAGLKYDKFFVKFEWTPAHIYIDPTTQFGNENKIQQYWYKHDDNTTANAATGADFDDIHGNVEVVSSTNSCAYVFDIRNTLLGNKISVSNFASPYDGLNSSLTSTLEFEDITSPYPLYADNSNAPYSWLYATKSATDVLSNPVAKMDKTTGIVEFLNNAKAKELLNKVAHTDLANSLTASVRVKATLCGNLQVPVSSNQFYVKFLRPVNITGAEVTFTDAETSGSEHAISVGFQDWRNYKFNVDKATKGVDYFTYYGVTKIEVITDVNNATYGNKIVTNISGSEKPLKNVTNNLQFTYTAGSSNPVVENDYGKLKYENNGNTVGGFYVKFPMIVTYKWGTIETMLTCNVTHTIANARK